MFGFAAISCSHISFCIALCAVHKYFCYCPIIIYNNAHILGYPKVEASTSTIDQILIDTVDISAKSISIVALQSPAQQRSLYGMVWHITFFSLNKVIFNLYHNSCTILEMYRSFVHKSLDFSKVISFCHWFVTFLIFLQDI